MIFRLIFLLDLNMILKSSGLCRFLRNVVFTPRIVIRMVCRSRGLCFLVRRLLTSTLVSRRLSLRVRRRVFVRRICGRVSRRL